MHEMEQTGCQSEKGIFERNFTEDAVQDGISRNPFSQIHIFNVRCLIELALVIITYYFRYFLIKEKRKRKQYAVLETSGCRLLNDLLDWTARRQGPAIVNLVNIYSASPAPLNPSSPPQFDAIIRNNYIPPFKKTIYLKTVKYN